MPLIETAAERRNANRPKDARLDLLSKCLLSGGQLAEGLSAACPELAELGDFNHLQSDYSAQKIPMSKPLFDGVDHIAVICSDYVTSKKFYLDVLRMEIVSEEYREVRDSWKLLINFADGVQIELFSFPDSPARPSYPEALGLRHLALKVKDLDAAVAHIKSFDVPIEDIRVDSLTGARFVFFSDPDGLPLELYEC